MFNHQVPIYQIKKPVLVLSEVLVYILIKTAMQSCVLLFQIPYLSKVFTLIIYIKRTNM